MRYMKEVRGTQPQMPEDIESNGDLVYARANIQRVDEPDGDFLGFHGWQYEEVILSRSEFDRLKALDSSWIRVWSAAARTAERRARYERMDPKVSALRRSIDLGIDEETSKAKLLEVQRYCRAVQDTKGQSGYPEVVEYPEEPSV